MVRLNFHVSMMRRVRHSLPRFSLCPTCPERPHRGRARGAGHRIGPRRTERTFGGVRLETKKCPASQNPLGDALGNVLGCFSRLSKKSRLIAKDVEVG
jgi:hypothetical protein